MTNSRKAYGGRIIYDHLFKTAGQSINRWLIDSLGNRCVTPNLIGGHGELIRKYGGCYSVISGHIGFHGEGLDPRYHYVCCLRDPIDRVISALFFIVNNHTEEFFIGLNDPDQIALYNQAKKFIESEGDDVGPILRGIICNYYVTHFGGILTSNNFQNDKLNLAKTAIESYDLVGFFEDLDCFTDDFSVLLGMTPLRRLGRLNKGANRPSVEGISKKMLNKIVSMNFEDCALYEHAKNYWLKKVRRLSLCESRDDYIPYNHSVEAVARLSNGFNLLNFYSSYDAEVIVGSEINFVLEIDFSEEILSPVWGIHIFDEYGAWAFGINSEMMGYQFSTIGVGRHSVKFSIEALLPAGVYSVGFALLGRVNGNQVEIAWFDSLASLSIRDEKKYIGIGYAPIPAVIEMFGN
jgi:hypothetical protein